MERYTDEERLVIVTAYMDCGQNIAATLRKITDNFALHKRPSRTAVVKLIKKFKRTGSVSNLRRTFRNREDQQTNDRTFRNCEDQQSNDNTKVTDIGNNSIHITAQQLGISIYTLQRILQKDLNLHLLKNATIHLSKQEHKLMVFVMNRAARIIQRYWRNYRLSRLNNMYLEMDTNAQFRY